MIKKEKSSSINKNLKTIPRHHKDQLDEIIFRDTLENINLIAVALDLEGNINFCNEYLLKLTGWKKEEIIGKNWFEYFLSANVKDEVLKMFKEAINSGNLPLHYINEIITKSGETRIINWNNTKICDSKNRMIGALSIGEDITEKQKAEREIEEWKQRYEIIVDSSGQLVYDYNVITGKIIWGGSIGKVLGYTSDEMGSVSKWTELIHPEDRQWAVSELERCEKEKKPYECEYRFMDKRGKYLHIHDRGLFLYDNEGRAYRMLGTMEDVSARKQAEQAVTVQSLYFEQLFKNINLGIAMLDSQNRILAVNKAFEDTFGYSISEILGKDINELLVPEELKEESQYLSSITFDRQIAKKESYRKRKDGSLVYVRILGVPIEFKGEIVGIYGIYEDITARKISEELIRNSELQFRSVWESSFDGMRLIDGDGNFLLVNEAFCRMCEKTKDELIGKPFNIVYKFDDDRYNLETFKLNFQNKSIPPHIEREITLWNGKIIWIELSNSFVEIKGKSPLLLSIFRDITERKRTQIELQREKERAEEANRLKSGFISTMSHEIRTPLNVIMGYNSLLKDLYYESAATDIRQFFDMVDQASGRLLTTITQILDISRLEANEFPVNLHPILLNELAQNNFYLFRNEAEKKGLQLELILPNEFVVVEGDDYCLNGVFVNLINNAIKYSEKGTITIDISKESNFGKCVIKDEGIGMSDEYQKHLFETFSQEDVGINRKFEGTGLGLAITKKYLTLMNGRIEVESKKGIGTKVTFYVPLKT